MTRDSRGARGKRALAGGETLLADGHRRARGDGVEEILRHEFRHPDATVRGGITRQVAGVQADATHNAHEIWHRGTAEGRSRWLRIFVRSHVWHHDVPSVVHVIAEEVRHVILI